MAIHAYRLPMGLPVRGQGASEAVAAPGGAAGARPVAASRRGFLGAVATAMASTAAGAAAVASSSTVADAATNCMNVLANDRYWSSQFDVYRAVAYAGSLPPAFADADFTISDVPAIRSLMVWARNYAGAGWTGHVGIVETIGDDGTVLVKHENWPRGTREHLETFEVLPGHRFIHQRPPEPGTSRYPDEFERRTWSTWLAAAEDARDPG